ncbi:hypothetical protein Salat_2097900 [Sesamum alatum]|uniref:Uncharacterized protein n=1 Tax=Sesamum alatum TaxID=300844 RepID=A0AAE2CGM8_9LAMI|nr:hypothetical protein Salat_2097900 [Sesamum alatum]
MFFAIPDGELDRATWCRYGNGMNLSFHTGLSSRSKAVGRWKFLRCACKSEDYGVEEWPETPSQLGRISVVDHFGCPLCCGPWEDIKHALVGCPFAIDKYWKWDGVWLLRMLLPTGTLIVWLGNGLPQAASAELAEALAARKALLHSAEAFADHCQRRLQQPCVSEEDSSPIGTIAKSLANPF